MVRMQRIIELCGDGIWQTLDVAFEGPQIRLNFELTRAESPLQIYSADPALHL